MGIKGRVTIEFIIGRDGLLGDVKVVENTHDLLTDEVLCLVYSSPRWAPGTVDGTPVRVKYTMPFLFRLQLTSPLHDMTNMHHRGSSSQRSTYNPNTPSLMRNDW